MIRKNNILVIDDDEDTVVLLTMMFKLQGFFVSYATTSEGGLCLAKEGGFVAIILDNKLPDSTGADLCREIRKFDSLTPVIFFSASVFERDREECLSAGSQAYLLKPDDVDTIVDTVFRYVKLKQTSGA